MGWIHLKFGKKKLILQALQMSTLEIEVELISIFLKFKIPLQLSPTPHGDTHGLLLIK